MHRWPEFGRGIPSRNATSRLGQNTVWTWYKFPSFGISKTVGHQCNTKLYSPIMVETQNTTMLNKEIKYDSSPTLTILFTKQSTPLYRVNCPACRIYKFSNGFTVEIILTNLNNFLWPGDTLKTIDNEAQKAIDAIFSCCTVIWYSNCKVNRSRKLSCSVGFSSYKLHMSGIIRTFSHRRSVASAKILLHHSETFTFRVRHNY